MMDMKTFIAVILTCIAIAVIVTHPYWFFPLIVLGTGYWCFWLISPWRRTEK